MRNLALAIVLLASTSAAAQSQLPWTEEELASGVRREDIVRYAFSGQKMNLTFLYALEADCSPIDGWEFEIIKQPEHGAAELKPHTGFASYPKGNVRTKCNEQKVEGFMLTYKADANYKGPDAFTYLMISPGGMAVERTYRFNVRALPATTSGKKQRGA
jgi:hypothetical protein